MILKIVADKLENIDKDLISFIQKIKEGYQLSLDDLNEISTLVLFRKNMTKLLSTGIKNNEIQFKKITKILKNHIPCKKNLRKNLEIKYLSILRKKYINQKIIKYKEE